MSIFISGNSWRSVDLGHGFDRALSASSPQLTTAEYGTALSVTRSTSGCTSSSRSKKDYDQQLDQFQKNLQRRIFCLNEQMKTKLVHSGNEACTENFNVDLGVATSEQTLFEKYELEKKPSIKSASSSQLTTEYGASAALSLAKSNSGWTSPFRAKTVKEYDQQLNDFQKENFSLKLRIFFLEEKMKTKLVNNGDEACTKNSNLELDIATLKQELSDKNELLKKASAALTNLSDGHRVELSQVRDELRDELCDEFRARARDDAAAYDLMIADLQMRLLTTETKLEATQGQLAEARAQVDDLLVSNTTLQTQWELADEESHSVKKKLQTIEKWEDELRIEVDSMKDESKEKDRLIAQLVKEMTNIESKDEVKNEALRTITQEFNQKLSELNRKLLIRTAVDAKEIEMRSCEKEVLENYVIALQSSLKQSNNENKKMQELFLRERQISIESVSELNEKTTLIDADIGELFRRLKHRLVHTEQALQVALRTNESTVEIKDGEIHQLKALLRNHISKCVPNDALVTTSEDVDVRRRVLSSRDEGQSFHHRVANTNVDGSHLLTHNEGRNSTSVKAPVQNRSTLREVTPDEDLKADPKEEEPKTEQLSILQEVRDSMSKSETHCSPNGCRFEAVFPLVGRTGHTTNKVASHLRSGNARDSDIRSRCERSFHFRLCLCEPSPVDRIGGRVEWRSGLRRCLSDSVLERISWSSENLVTPFVRRADCYGELQDSTVHSSVPSTFHLGPRSERCANRPTLAKRNADVGVQTNADGSTDLANENLKPCCHVLDDAASASEANDAAADDVDESSMTSDREMIFESLERRSNSSTWFCIASRDVINNTSRSQTCLKSGRHSIRWISSANTAPLTSVDLLGSSENTVETMLRGDHSSQAWYSASSPSSPQVPGSSSANSCADLDAVVLAITEQSKDNCEYGSSIKPAESWCSVVSSASVHQSNLAVFDTHRSLEEGRVHLSVRDFEKLDCAMQFDNTHAVDDRKQSAGNVQIPMDVTENTKQTPRHIVDDEMVRKPAGDSELSSTECSRVNSSKTDVERRLVEPESSIEVPPENDPVSLLEKIASDRTTRRLASIQLEVSNLRRRMEKACQVCQKFRLELESFCRVNQNLVAAADQRPDMNDMEVSAAIGDSCNSHQPSYLKHLLQLATTTNQSLKDELDLLLSLQLDPVNSDSNRSEWRDMGQVEVDDKPSCSSRVIESHEAVLQGVELTQRTLFRLDSCVSRVFTNTKINPVGQVPAELRDVLRSLHRLMAKQRRTLSSLRHASTVELIASNAELAKISYENASLKQRLAIVRQRYAKAKQAIKSAEQRLDWNNCQKEKRFVAVDVDLQQNRV